MTNMTFFEAALKVLKEANGGPLHFKEICDRAVSAGYLAAAAQNSDRMMGAYLYVHVKRAAAEGKEPQVKKVGPGRFALVSAADAEDRNPDPELDIEPVVDDAVFADLLTELGRLVGTDVVTSPKLIDGYRENFRRRFGPDRLARVKGTELLSMMHEHGSHDSLVYWLEFKNDEEFAAVFGSIAGGTSLKFGIYRRRETGEWMTGSSSKQRQISEAEAVEYATRHRDELLEAVRLFEALPPDAGQDDYDRLQADMQRLAPTIQDLAWAHKYLSLLFPDKLDDYHNEDYKRYHLVKLLVLPPAVQGRYAAAGPLVRLALQMGVPVDHLTSLLSKRNGRPHRYWRLGTRAGTSGESFWPMMKERGCAAIGYDRIGELPELEYNAADKARLKELLGKAYPGELPQWYGNRANQLFAFLLRAQDGDLVVACDGTKVLGIGRIAGPAIYDPTVDFPHQRPVDWLDTGTWKLPQNEGLQSTFRPLGKHAENLVAIEDRLFRRTPVSVIVDQSSPSPLTGIPAVIQDILERKGQVILYGPPGTGKTWWAEQAAREMAARAEFHRTWNDLTETERSTITGGSNAHTGLVRMCSFHPAYGYEDFIEGYRPTVVRGALVFERRDGIFKQLCADAAKAPNCRHYLIIDEINRGDIPRIFGELLTVLEKTRRGTPILLPQSGEPFTVPQNIVVIGTMNTADRSIALLDKALRRRFGFVSLMPDVRALGDAKVKDIPLGLWLNELNRRIRQFVGRDARNLQVGHAYLMKNGKAINLLADFVRVLRDDIVPLLEDYCYEDYVTLAKILGRGLVDNEIGDIRAALFEERQWDELLQAMRFPEIALAAGAVDAALEEEELETDTDTDDEA
jgi:5-methylcytosine-specific restriction protein B